MWPKPTKGFKSAFGLTCQFIVFYFEHRDQNTCILDSILGRAKIKHLKVYMVFYLSEQLFICCQTRVLSPDRMWWVG